MSDLTALLPVVDLKAGQVVRGVGGRRDEYRPIQSTIARDALPGAIAHAFAGLGFCDAYVADLDAIGGDEPAWDAYQQLAAAIPHLLIDAGVRNAAHAESFLRIAEQQGLSLAGVIVGLESIERLSELQPMLSAIGVDRLIFSLDMRNGQPLCRDPLKSELSPFEIAANAIRAGVRRLIVLDLVTVGAGVNESEHTRASIASRGVLEICRDIRAAYPQVELISGGGVRNLADVDAFLAAGCNRILIASALHDGAITAADIERYRNQRS